MGRKPCCCKVGLKRGAWSSDEDKLLIDHIRTHGEAHWRSLPSKAGLLRCGKSCRLRWVNYLRPGIKRGNFTTEEDDIIIRLHSLHGNRWSLIATELSGRTDNEIKNYWNAHLRMLLNNQKTKTMSRKKPKQVKLLASASASCSSVSSISTSKNKSIENEMTIGASSTYMFDLEDVDFDFDFTWLNSEPFLEVEDKSRSDDQKDEGLLMDGWKSFMLKDDESLMLEKVYQEHVNLLNHQDVNENTNEIKKIL